MMAANKPALADAIWALTPRDVVGPTGQRQYILYGRSLVHRIPWQRDMQAVHKVRHQKIWPCGTCHYCLRRVSGRTIYERWCSWTPHRSKSRPNSGFHTGYGHEVQNGDLLSNKDNKQRFIRMLCQSLEYVGCQTRHANGDAAVLILETTAHTAMYCETTLVGDDTYMLVLLCFHVKEDYCEVFFKPEIWSGTKNGPWWWDIKTVQRVMGRAVCNNMLFEHAILGCDTTFRLFNIGKGLALKLIRSDNHFIMQDGIFLQWHIKRRRSSPSMYACTQLQWVTH